MYHPEDLENENGHSQDDLVSDGSQSGEQQTPQWFRVSYQSQSNGVQPPPIVMPLDEEQPRTGRLRRIAFLAAFIAVCVALSALAGFGGALVANYWMETTSPQGSGEPSRTAFYRNWIDDGYAYGQAVSDIRANKNDGSALSDSKFGSAGNAPLSTIEVVSAVADSVVEITATVIQQGGTSTTAGSGVIIHADGIVVTNNHVVENASFVYVHTTNGDTYEASVRGRDAKNDIAVLKITPLSQEKLTVAKLGCSAALAVGEEVLAIGNPLGQLGGTVTEGIISALERDVQVEGVTMKLLQTSAAINSGNSGGGLFNMAGELIGVVNAKYKATGVEGLGFAIPIDTAMMSVSYLLTGK